MPAAEDFVNRFWRSERALAQAIQSEVPPGRGKITQLSDLKILGKSFDLQAAHGVGEGISQKERSQAMIQYPAERTNSPCILRESGGTGDLRLELTGRGV